MDTRLGEFEQLLLFALVRLGDDVHGVDLRDWLRKRGALSLHESLDAMIQGDGFFQVELPNGEVGYTRAGKVF